MVGRGKFLPYPPISRISDTEVTVSDTLNEIFCVLAMFLSDTRVRAFDFGEAKGLHDALQRLAFSIFIVYWVPRVLR